MTKSPPTTVFLLRHGQTVNTLDGKFRYNGHIDVEVTDESLETMRSIARQLEAKHITHIYSSNLRRSQAGAAVIADQLELPLTPLSAFREIKMGCWEGLTYDEVKERYPEQIKKKFTDFINYRIPGGETIPEVENRVFNQLDELLHTHSGEQLVIVAHGGINMLIICRALQMAATNIFRLKQDFCCVNQLDYYHDFVQVNLVNSPCLP
ncbi:MAG TPA: histidine phosphatase family protein [Proteobacteria bacterium]|nr:histidine phosphatase family protein [Pseudomonadota bacterium]